MITFILLLLVQPVFQYEEADDGSSLFGLRRHEWQKRNNDVAQQGAQVRRLHAPHKTVPCPVEHVQEGANQTENTVTCLPVSAFVCGRTGSTAGGSPLGIAGPCAAWSSSSPAPS